MNTLALSPTARYRTIVADPPWPLVGDQRARSRPLAARGGRRGRETFFPYEPMPLDAIEDLPVSELAEAAAHLYLWVPASFNREGVGTRVARAWGFGVVSEIVWDKITFGLGKFPRPQHEILLVCRRGPFALPGQQRRQRPALARATSQRQAWPHPLGQARRKLRPDRAGQSRPIRRAVRAPRALRLGLPHR